jgi:hypothetical protein
VQASKSVLRSLLKCRAACRGACAVNLHMPLMAQYKHYCYFNHYSMTYGRFHHMWQQYSSTHQ